MGIEWAGWDRDGFETGKRNLVTDVPGVTVGHATVTAGAALTGVTAVLPHQGNVYRDKPVAAAHVINGYGKSAGTVQVQELGTVETPIVLTNTLSVGTASTALVRWMLERDAGIRSVNPLVLECNDGYLSDIRGLHVREEHVRAALETASADFAEGGAGAGAGMMCYECKGGIGSASRKAAFGGRDYTVGCLALTNFGSMRDLVLQHRPVGRELAQARDRAREREEGGSVIVLLATDLPLSSRQLGRLCRRVPAGLARTGAFLGNSSGEIALAFTTANRMPEDGGDAPLSFGALREGCMDTLFRLTANLAEEAVVSSMAHAETARKNGVTVRSLRELLAEK